MIKREKNSVSDQTIAEEVLNSLTHGIGAGLGIAGLVILVVLAAIYYSDPWKITSFAIYGASLIILYTVSALYHSISNLRLKKIFQIFDHSSIYILIAGTYTPLMLVNLRGPWGWSLFGIEWGLAIAGIAWKFVFKAKYEKVSTVLYVLMGWVVIVAFRELLLNMDSGGIAWLVLGGCLYTGGVVFFLWEKLPFQHVIWHLFVLAGSICHFFSMLFYVLPKVK